MARSSGGLSKSLSGASFGGLSRGRMQSGGFSKRLRFDKQRSSLVQFYGATDDSEAFKEYYVHSFKEDGNWKFVPCAGDNCPLCSDEDDEKRKKKYRFCAQVYDLDAREPLVMEGPKDLAQRIASKYEKGADRFLKMVWEVQQLPTTPVSYEVDSSDERRKKLSDTNPPSLQEYIDGEIARYHGEIKPKRSSLLADDDDDDEDERPRRKKRSSRDDDRPTRRRSSVRDDDDEDEDEDEQPRRRSTSSRSSRDRDEERPRRKTSTTRTSSRRPARDEDEDERPRRKSTSTSRDDSRSSRRSSSSSRTGSRNRR